MRKMPFLITARQEKLAVTNIKMPGRKSWQIAIVAASLILIVLLEIYLRLTFGFGNPPLMISDPEIEYYFKPSSCYRRFGNKICINQYAMRSDELLDKARYDARVAVIGDSVVYGGALVDQANISTEILKQIYEKRDENLSVLNISAGSWGPANQFAYINRFGLFDSDAVFLVLGSQDMADVPVFSKNLGSDNPVRQPTSAISELVGRYVIPRTPVIKNILYDGPSGAKFNYTDADRVKLGALALERLLARLCAEDIPIVIFFHAEQQEIKRGIVPPLLQKIVSRQGKCDIRIDNMAKKMPSNVGDIYRDNIHLTALGQRLYANEMARLIDGMGLIHRPLPATAAPIRDNSPS